LILDCHVHISACTPEHGFTSERLLNSIPFRYLRWKFGLVGADASTERAMEAKLDETIRGTPEIDAAVVLAFDAVHDADGCADWARTQLYVTNDYVMELSRRHRNMLFGASIHPYRKDAVAELERCVKAGAVLVKWLPPTQGINPADARCVPFYEALAHYQLPLLCHTGWEQMLPTIDPAVADPMLLEPALKRGVRVIAAHCGTRAMPWNTDFLPRFMHLAQEYEHFYGDTSALSLPTRWYALDRILSNEAMRRKLVHGSDWPIIPLPPVFALGWAARELMREPNWMRRDVLIKKRLGFDEAYWHRAAEVLGLG
jgi:predicted TIM-barrel fold metal-dependent hydrolase